MLDKGRKTDRLIYTSRFVHVIYSSCIVPIRHGTVTPLRRSGLRVHVRQDGPASAGLPALVQAALAARLQAVLPALANPLRTSGSAPTLVIVGQTSARFTSPSPARRLMEDLPAVLSITRLGNASCICRPFSLLMLRCYPATFHVFEQMNRSVISGCCY